MFQVDFNESSIILTEPYFNFTSIQEAINEILFEEYQFQSVYRTNGECVYVSLFLKFFIT